MRAQREVMKGPGAQASRILRSVDAPSSVLRAIDLHGLLKRLRCSAFDLHAGVNYISTNVEKS